MPAIVLEHACRSGKSTVAAVALGLVAGGGNGWSGRALRASQRQALEHMAASEELAHCALPIAPPAVPPVRAMMVFSSLAVLQQFVDEYVREWLKAGSKHRLVYVSSRPVGVTHPCTTDPDEIKAHLRSARQAPTLFVTTYESAHRIDEALAKIKNGKMGVVVFDEAHNLHTPHNHMFIGVEKGAVGEATQVCDPTVVNGRYPTRIYMTATPRDEMRRPVFAPIYGAPEAWDTYAYADLLEWQRAHPLRCNQTSN